MAQHQLGANTVVEEDQNGETVLKNTNTGNEVTLSSIVELTQALGSDTTPVPGTSHFEALNAVKQSTDQVVAEIRNDSINQTLINNTQTQLEYDTNYLEDSDIYTIDLTNNKITIDEQGKYKIDVNVNIQSDSDWTSGHEIIIIINANGSRISQHQRLKTSTENEQFLVGEYYEASAGDDITVTVEQKSGADKQINSFGVTNQLRLVRVA